MAFEKKVKVAYGGSRTGHKEVTEKRFAKGGFDLYESKQAITSDEAAQDLTEEESQEAS